MSDKYKNIDDLFKDQFKDFELDPPEHVWGNIKGQIPGPGNGGKSGMFKNGGIFGLSIFLILAGILSWYLLNSSSENSAQIQVIESTQATESDYISSPRNIDINSNEEKDQETTASKDKKKQKTRFDISEPASVHVGTSSLLVHQENSKSDDISTSNHHSAGEELVFANELASLGILTAGGDEELLAIQSTTQTNDDYVEEIIAKDVGLAGDSSDPEQEDIDSAAGVESLAEVKSDYGKRGNWMFGVFFTPEMIFYPDNSMLNNRSYAVDVNAIYKFSGYLLQSGLGVSWISDEGSCEIDYNKYLGAYEDVYNVTYDTIGNELSPVYHTETVKVYDSIDHVSIMPTKNRYTYLQIPLLFGYGNENKRFGWFVKGGPSLSIMINKDMSSNNMSDTEDKVLQIDNEIPARINTNWQFVFSAGVSYRLSNSLSFTAEPIFRYYLNSTYERTKLNLKNPYSLGLRVGFNVDF